MIVTQRVPISVDTNRFTIPTNISALSSFQKFVITAAFIRAGGAILERGLLNCSIVLNSISGTKLMQHASMNMIKLLNFILNTRSYY